jgi:O-acetyl-ADP-ribose deacetylase (regulator of RNase III)
MDNQREGTKDYVIEYVTGNILESDCQCLVNPVNTVGVMGKGLAKQFKMAYPAMMESYVDNCLSGALVPGRLMFYQPNDSEKILCLFPTKTHWHLKSELKYVERGLIAFTEYYEEWNITSVAFPMLGCGLGGLDWQHHVKPLMEMYLSKLPIRVEIYH